MIRNGGGYDSFHLFIPQFIFKEWGRDLGEHAKKNMGEKYSTLKTWAFSVYLKWSISIELVSRLFPRVCYLLEVKTFWDEEAELF